MVISNAVLPEEMLATSARVVAREHRVLCTGTWEVLAAAPVCTEPTRGCPAQTALRPARVAVTAATLVAGPVPADVATFPRRPFGGDGAVRIIWGNGRTFPASAGLP